MANEIKIHETQSNGEHIVYLYYPIASNIRKLDAVTGLAVVPTPFTETSAGAGDGVPAGPDRLFTAAEQAALDAGEAFYAVRTTGATAEAGLRSLHSSVGASELAIYNTRYTYAGLKFDA